MSYNDGIFNINSINGFLPIYEPSNDVPEEFLILKELTEKMPLWLDEERTKKGILGNEGQIKIEINNLPNLVDKITDKLDIKIIQTLYRFYAFLSSAYLLEPTYYNYLKTKEYGNGEKILPRQLAMPLHKLCKILGIYNWLDYHYSYCLCNVRIKDKKKPPTWDNMELLTKFAGTSDERGFITVHVDINQYSPLIIESIEMIKNNKYIEKGYKLNYEAMKKCNERRLQMYKASSPKNYHELRMFIMGSKGNKDIFGEGVLYEGVSDELLSYRGQTGAQDDIIPTEDIITGVIDHYPENKLTDYLMELREYRPIVVRKFMNDLYLDFKRILQKKMSDETLLYMLLSVEQIYKFRHGHWQLVYNYIMKYTRYNKATGGTPITKWLPNQIDACLKRMFELIEKIKIENLSEDLKEKYKETIKNHSKYRILLNKQMRFLNESDEVEKLYDTDKEVLEG